MGSEYLPLKYEMASCMFQPRAQGKPNIVSVISAAVDDLALDFYFCRACNGLCFSPSIAGFVSLLEAYQYY